MKTLFRNPEDNRLRAGWRIFLFLVLFFIGSSLIFVLRPLLGVESKRAFLTDYSVLIVSVLAIAATVTVYLSRKWWDIKSFSSLGLWNNGKLWKDLFFGLFLSFCMAGLFVLSLYSLGYLSFEGLQWSSISEIDWSNGFPGVFLQMSLLSVGLLLVETILVGYWEELVFRGYLLQNMMEGMGAKLAIVVSCLLYGLIHASNPNATLLSSAIIVAFGFLRIYGYLATGCLWLSMGMHIGWNFFQGPIFGFAASGHTKATLLQHTTTGQDWLTGGAFGPEGSILILPILLLALLSMRWWSQKHSVSNRMVLMEA